MSGKRLLSDSISTSGRLNRLSSEAFNIWTLCHPHTDRDGRLPADREDLIGQCFPRRYIFLGWTHEIVDRLIQELVDAELWMPLVDDRGVGFIAELRFREHQPGLHPGKYLYDEREKPSKYQYSGPDPDEIIKDRARDVHAVCTPGAPDVHAMCKKTPQVQVQVQAQALEVPADPPVREKKKRPKKETRWKPSQVIDAHRLVIGDPDYGRADLPGPDLGGLKALGSLDLVDDLSLFWNRSANWLQGKGMTVSIGAIVRSIAYLDPSGLPRRANGSSVEPASRSARRAQDVVSNINPETIETYKREQGITDGS